MTPEDERVELFFLREELAKLRKALPESITWGNISGKLRDQQDIAKNFRLRLSSKITNYIDAVLPLSDTDEIIVFQGGIPKKVKKQNLIGSTSSTIKKYLKYTHKATGAGVSVFGDTPLTSVGSLSDYVDPTTLIPFRQIATSATPGAIAEFRQGTFSRKLGTQKGDLSLVIFFDTGGFANYRCFGGASQTSVLGNIDPSQYASYLFGIGADAADTNYQLIYGENNSSRTKIDLGWPKTGKKIFFIFLDNIDSATSTKVTVKNISDNLTYTNTINFNVKDGYRVWCSNNTNPTSVNVGLGLIELNVEI